VERVVVERLMGLAGNAGMPQVRALASDRLQAIARAAALPRPDRAEAAHAALLAQDIQRFLTRPLAPVTMPAAPVIPPGAPIG
jgi:hypothetical protein